MRRLAAGLIVALWPAAGHAGDLSRLYEPHLLRELQPQYQEIIDWNYENAIWPVLSSEEREALHEVRIAVRVPGEVAAQARGHPFQFYADPGSSLVVMPALSIRFFGELCLAFAWLDRHGGDTAAVASYVAMLKHKDASSFPRQRYPTPLEALGIPDDVRDDAFASDVADKALNSALIFILAHELGHVYHRHGGALGADQSQQHETEADAFAIDLMQRMALPPSGMALWFAFAKDFVMNRADFASDEAWQVHLRDAGTHPLSGERLRRIGHRLREAAAEFGRGAPEQEAAARANLAVAEEMEILAPLVDDPDLQRLVAARGRASDPTSGRGDDVGARAPAELFSGEYAGTYSHGLHGGGMEVLDADVRFLRDGDRVQGQLDYGLGPIELSGLVSGDRLYFEWTWLGASGSGVLEAQGEALSGTWGFARSATDGGALRLSRR